MIILTIGDTSRRLSATGIEESWVRLQLRSGAASVASPGVHVRIDAPPISLNLSAGDAPGRGLPDRPLEPGEAKVLALWEERGLDRPDFRGGQLLAFLHQLYDVLDQVLAVLPSEVTLPSQGEERGRVDSSGGAGRDTCMTSRRVEGDSPASVRYISGGARSSGG